MEFNRSVLVVAFAVVLGMSASNAADFPRFLDRLQLQDWARSAEFGKLESAFSIAYANYASGKNDDRVIGHAFEAFSSTSPGLEAPLDQWIEEHPDSAHAHVARGMYRTELGWNRRGSAWASETSKEQFQGMAEAFDLAIKDFHKAIDIDPGLTTPYAELISIASGYGDKESIDRLRKVALSRQPASYMVRISLANALRPKWSGSMEELRDFVNETERHIRSNTALAAIRGVVEVVRGDWLYRKGRNEDALDAYSAALRFGERAPYHGELGDVYKRMERYEEAVAEYSRALELWPQNPYYLRKRGDVYRKMGRTSDAESDYDLALALDSLNERALDGMARVLITRQESDAALEAAKKALEYGGDKAHRWNLVGWILYYNLGEKEQSAQYFKRATEIDNDYPGYWYHLAASQYHAKDCDVSESMERYIELCAGGATCKTKRVRWARKAGDHLKKRGICN